MHASNEQAVPTDVTTQFHEAYMANELLKSKLPPSIQSKNNEHKIYTKLELNVLVNELKKQQQSTSVAADSEFNEDEYDHCHSARFVVCQDKNIFFSLEGPCSKTVPSHADIVGTVLTAGNLHFSDNYSEITKITNKSGHFKPSFASLVFAIPLILKTGYPLAQMIGLFDISSRQNYEFSKRELSTLLPSDLSSTTAVSGLISPPSPLTTAVSAEDIPAAFNDENYDRNAFFSPNNRKRSLSEAEGNTEVQESELFLILDFEFSR